MLENPESLSDDELERELLAATAENVSGRRALARVTALRTILKRRTPPETRDEDAAKALLLVNATRGPDDQLTEVHPTWVASILADPGWAELYLSDEEMRQMNERRELLSDGSEL